MNVLSFLPNLPSGSNLRDSNSQANMSQSAWQREMERAEAQSWLLHPLVRHQSSAALFGSSAYLLDSSRLPNNGQQPDGLNNSVLPESRFRSDGAHSASPSKFFHPSNSSDLENGNSHSEIGKTPTLGGTTISGESDSSICANGGVAEELLQQLNLSLGEALDSINTIKNEDAAIANDGFNLKYRSKESTGKSEPLTDVVGSVNQRSLRLHAEWSDRGVYLWLGVDSKDEAAIPHLVSHVISQLRGCGIDVAALVCNGKTLYDNSIQRHATESHAYSPDDELMQTLKNYQAIITNENRQVD